jgi:hypothetical protein
MGINSLPNNIFLRTTPTWPSAAPARSAISEKAGADPRQCRVLEKIPVSAGKQAQRSRRMAKSNSAEIFDSPAMARGRIFSGVTQVFIPRKDYTNP